jgi:hypothetical protein
MPYRLRKSRHFVDYPVSCIGCSFILKAGGEESIVNAPLARLQNKNTNSAKSEVRFKQLIIRGAFTIDSSTPTLRIYIFK